MKLKRLKRGPRNVELTVRVFTDVHESEFRKKKLRLVVSKIGDPRLMSASWASDEKDDTDFLEVAEVRGLHSLGDDMQRAAKAAKGAKARKRKAR